MSKYWEKINWNDVSHKKDKFHEAGLLKLNCDKALCDLNWIPTLNFSDTVRMTASWYETYYQDKDYHMLMNPDVGEIYNELEKQDERTYYLEEEDNYTDNPDDY